MNNIKKAREAMNLSQKQVALELKVAPPTVSEWESGKKFPAGKRLSKLSEFLGVSTDYLLGKSEEPNPASPPDFSEYMKQLNPLTGKKMTSRERKQLAEVLESAAEALFFDDEISDHDKEETIQALNESFWMAKKMNRRKKPAQDENM